MLTCSLAATQDRAGNSLLHPRAPRRPQKPPQINLALRLSLTRCHMQVQNLDTKFPLEA